MSEQGQGEDAREPAVTVTNVVPLRARSQYDDADDGFELRALGIPPFTDAGNAEAFAAFTSSFARYAHGPNEWLIWDGTRWARDTKRNIYTHAINAARFRRQDVPNLSTKVAVQLIKHAEKSEKRERIEAMLSLARSLPPLAIVPAELDGDNNLLNVANGTVDLRTGELTNHNARQLLTRLASVPYFRHMPAPTWTAFLERVMPDADMRAYLQRAVGYSLTGNVSEHCLFFCFGSGANGKSVFFETIRTLLGEGEYAKSGAPDLLLAKRQDQHEEQVAELRGARFVTTTEIGENRSWDEARVKWLTGGDIVNARHMHSSRFSFAPTHKFWIAANHKPRVKGMDHGFWRRVHLVPFVVTIPEAERDPDLTAKLRAELPGILAWAVEGAVEWRRQGLRPPDAVRAATDNYRRSEDVIHTFLDERCVINPAAFVPVSEIFDAFTRWAQDVGEKTMTKRAFSDALEERPGISRYKGTGGVRRLSGVCLKAESEGPHE